MALEKLEQNEGNKLCKQRYIWAIDGLKAKLNPPIIDKKILKTYAGNYGPRNISFEKGELFYQLGNGPKYKMIPISEDYFYFKDIDYFRLKIIRKNNVVVGVDGLYDSGRVDSNVKTNM